MALGSNPALSRLPRSGYGEHTLTYDSVLRKTLGALGAVFAGGAAGWFVPGLYIPGLIIGTVLAFIIIFKDGAASRGMVLAYAVFEGMTLGGVSASFEECWPGIVLQAILAVACVSAATFWVFRKKGVRATGRFISFTLASMIGLLLFSLVNLVLKFTGAVDGIFGMSSAMIPGTGIPWGVPIGLFAVLVCAASLIIDLTEVEDAVKAGMSDRYGWYLAFGLILTLVWMYLEMLRLIALLRGDD